MQTDQTHTPPADRAEIVAAPIRLDEAAEALKYGPAGAFFVSAIAVGILFIGWLAFYFFLFLPRGSIG